MSVTAARKLLTAAKKLLLRNAAEDAPPVEELEKTLKDLPVGEEQEITKWLFATRKNNKEYILTSMDKALQYRKHWCRDLQEALKVVQHYQDFGEFPYSDGYH